MTYTPGIRCNTCSIILLLCNGYNLVGNDLIKCYGLIIDARSTPEAPFSFPKKALICSFVAHQQLCKIELVMFGVSTTLVLVCFVNSFVVRHCSNSSCANNPACGKPYTAFLILTLSTHLLLLCCSIHIVHLHLLRCCLTLVRDVHTF